MPTDTLDLELLSTYQNRAARVEHARSLPELVDLPSPESEAVEERIPGLDVLTDLGGKALETVGKAAKKAGEAISPALDTAAKAIGLDLPPGGAGQAVEAVTGLPLTEQQSATEAGVSTALSALPAVGAATRAVKTLRLTHYSPKPNLQLLDPYFAGTNKGATEIGLGRPPQLFTYIEGTRPEALFKGNYKYTIEVPEDRIAQGEVYEEFRKKYRDPNERIEAIKKAGYIGWRDQTQPKPFGQAVMLFDEYRPVYVPRAVTPLSPKRIKDTSAISAADLYQTGGSTVHAVHGNLRGTNAYAVAVHPELRTYVKGLASQADVEKWLSTVSRQIDLNDDMLAVGTWFDERTGQTELSVSLVFPNLDDALHAAVALKEDAIYSLGSSQTVWVKPYLEQEAKGPNSDYARHLLQLLTKAEKKALVKGEEGSVDVRAALSLAGALVGGAYGWASTPEGENRALNALTDAGLGALAPVALSIARAMGRTRMRTGASSPAGPAAALTAAERPSSLHEIAQRYREAVDRYRRGVRPHALAREEGAQLLAAGYIDDTYIATRYPGSTYSDAEIAAFKEFLAQEGEKLRSLAAAFNRDPSNPDLERAFLQQLATYGRLNPLDIGLEAEAGRSLSFLNDVENEVNAFTRHLSSAVNKLRATQSPKRMAEMVADTPSLEALHTWSRTVTTPGLWDMGVEAWINGLLSQPITFVANVVSNSTTLLTSVPERALAAGFGAVHQGDRVVPGEATALLHGYLSSMASAWAAAARAFRTGAPLFGTDKLEAPTAAITAENFNLALQRMGLDPLTGAWAKGIDYLGHAARLPGRALMAADEFFKGIAFRGELSAQAYRHAYLEAQADGLTGKALRAQVAKRYNEILNDPTQWAAFRKDAEEFASYVTFTRELGEYGQGIQHAASSPLGRIVLPFVRTPTNIAKYAGERTPFAVFSKAVRDEIAAGGPRRDLALAKIAAGSSFAALAGTLAAAGVITGSGPQDKETRRLWTTDGRKPYSINVTGLKRLVRGEDPSPQDGDTWVAYSRIDPIGMIIGLSAEFADIAMHTDDPEIRDNLAARVATVTAHVMSSKTYVKGLAEWVFAAVDPEHYGGKLEESLARTVTTTVPIVGPAAKLVQRAIDPVVRETDGVIDAIKSTIPSLSNTIPPRINYWGEVVMREGWMAERALSPLYRSRHVKDPVVERLVEAGVSLSQPRDTIGKIKLTPQQKHDLYVLFGTIEIGGKTIHQRYEEILNRLWDRTPPHLRRDPQSTLHLVLQKTEQAYKDVARQELLKRYPDLQKAVNDELVERGAARKLTPALTIE